MGDRELQASEVEHVRTPQPHARGMPAPPRLTVVPHLEGGNEMCSGPLRNVHGIAKMVVMAMCDDDVRRMQIGALHGRDGIACNEWIDEDIVVAVSDTPGRMTDE